MTETSKVTVILTSYNHAQYLHESIDSVLNQTYPDFDLIIWDDGSTDDSWEIIQSYSDHRIKAIRNPGPDRGSPLRNVISTCETGAYIAIHHSDDAWEPEKLARQVAFLDENPGIDAVFTRVKMTGEQGESFDDQSNYYFNVFDQPNRSRHEWLRHFFFEGNALCHPSLMLRRECYADAGLYRYGMAHIADIDMWVRLCLKHEIFILPERLVRFRIRANDLNSSADRPEQRIRVQFEYMRILDHFRQIQDADEFLKIFPSAEKYCTQQGIDLDFALAMVALEGKPRQFAELFSLNILFDLINDPTRAARLKELYGFGNNEFLALTGQYDIFSVEVFAALKQAIDAYKTRLAHIEGSWFWRLAQFLRRIYISALRLLSLKKK